MASPKRARGPRALSASLPKVAKKILRGQGFTEGRVITDWPDIVGRPLADHCSPERLSPNGTLSVRVDGGWALELQHLEPVLLERIATFFGYRAVTRLALVQGPLPERPAPPRPAPRPLTSEEEVALDAALGETDDVALRAALQRLGRSVIADTDDDTALEG